MTTKDKLISAATAYDRKQAGKPHYNHYALGQYFIRIDEIMRDIEAGADIRKAICAGTCGRLATALLKAMGLPSWSRADEGGGIVYRPVKAKGKL